MKKVLRIIGLIAAVIAIVVGIITTINSENSKFFIYSDCSSTTVIKDPRTTTGFRVSMHIDNQTKTDFSNVTIKVDVEYGRFAVMVDDTSITRTVELDPQDLAIGDNHINFEFVLSNDEIYFKQIKNVKIVAENGVEYKAYLPFELAIEWYSIALIIIGFFSIVIIIATRKPKKTVEYNETGFGTIKRFEENIRNSFSQINNQTNNSYETKPTKNTCKYCGCQYSKTYEKCPHCGAPPERND